MDAEKPALYLPSPKRSYDEYRTRNNSLPRRGEKVHDSRNRGERVLMHRARGNAIDDLLFYNLACDSGRRRRRRVTHFDNHFISAFKSPIILATDVDDNKINVCKLRNKQCNNVTHTALSRKDLQLII